MKRIIIPENPFKDTTIGKTKNNSPQKKKGDSKKLKTVNVMNKRESDCGC